MLAYLGRRILYAIPILIGVNLLTFFLFFVVNSPEDIARSQLGDRRVTDEAIVNWKQRHGYDRPLFFDHESSGLAKLTDTIFFEKSLKLFVFDFGRSDSGRDIGYDIRQRMWPSLAIAAPTVLLGLLLNISFALTLAFLRGTYVDFWGVVFCVMLLSISSLFYIIAGQYLLSKLFHLVPISGFHAGVDGLKFLILPIVVGVATGVGAHTRLYRTVFLEEISKDYVRTARAKGIAEPLVMMAHVLPNALLPVLTGIVVILPTLFLGSLLVESFFAVPGLGSYTIDGIQRQDFAIVRSMVFLGSVLYIAGLLLTDLSYCWADPRVSLND